MKHSSIAILSIAATLAFAPAVMAQVGSENSRAVQGNGNTTIVFQHTDNSGLEVDHLQTWGAFAQAHPNIARALAYQPSLMDNDSYLSKHPDLEAFFTAHPEVRESMAANPGNYNAIPPRPGE